jgi:Fe-S-cluster formation regulator IscX/YfhJ
MLENHKRSVRSWEKENPQRLARNARFVEMHKKISELNVPEDDLFLCNLKKFMLEQLGMDLPSKDSEKWHKKPELPTKKDAAEYLAHEIKYAKEQLTREEKELHEYIQNVQKRKDSVKKLKKILEGM